MTQRNARDVLNESFLEMRAKLLEVAASLDRIEGADGGDQLGSRSADPQRSAIDQAIRIVGSGESHRAARLQLLFSREYHDDWRDQMQL